MRKLQSLRCVSHGSHSPNRVMAKTPYIVIHHYVLWRLGKTDLSRYAKIVIDHNDVQLALFRNKIYRI